MIGEGEDRIESEEDLKLLGFRFGSKPNVDRQVEHILYRANLRFFALRSYAESMLS